MTAERIAEIKEQLVWSADFGDRANLAALIRELVAAVESLREGILQADSLDDARALLTRR